MTNETGDSDPLFRNKNVTNDVKRKVIAEKRAHEIVKQLLEEGIDKDVFIKSVYFLTEQHYQDIVEERVILKLCGYPLCDNSLENVAKQQYRISKNRVYDLTQRKHFCTDQCYRASEHVKKQIPTTPLWLRDSKNIQPVDLDSSGIGSKGEEVVISNRVEENCENTDTQNQEEATSGVKHVSFEATTSFHSSSNPPCPDAVVQDTLVSPSSTSNRNVQSRKTNVMDNVMGVLKDWITENTLIHIGLVAVKTPPTDELSGEEIRKIRKMKVIESKLKQIASGNSASTNDPEVLEQEAMDVYSNRVQMFYEGRMSGKEKVRFQEVEEKEVEKQPPIQPRIDSKNQASIRRNILHQKLAKVSQELFPRLPLVVTARDLRMLILTFNLTSTNIILKTNEYPLITIALIHIMTRYDDDVKDTFNQSKTLISHLLTAYKIELPQLQNAVDNAIEVMMINR